MLVTSVGEIRRRSGTLNPECQYYRPPKLGVNDKTGKTWEGAEWCDLDGHPCQLVYEGECEEYSDFLKEGECQNK